MTKISNLLYFLCFAFGCQILPGYASDLEKERRWSEQIVDALLVGEAVQLDAGGTAFLGIYTEASEGVGDRAVILLHGIGAHPDWPEIINPLRSELPVRVAHSLGGTGCARREQHRSWVVAARSGGDCACSRCHGSSEPARHHRATQCR